MKFENVKVGDIVFTERQIRYAWQSSERFFIPEKVIRTTKTQFIVESGDRYKKDGRKIGDSWTQSYFKGDKYGYSSNRIICDESEKMKSFELKLKTEDEIRSSIDKLNIQINSEFDIKELTEIKKSIDNISAILKKKNDAN